MKKMLSIILCFAMLLSLSTTAFASENNQINRINRDNIEALFTKNSISTNYVSSSSQNEEIVFQEILDKLQSLWFEQQRLSENGENTSKIDKEIVELENRIEQLSCVTKLSNEDIQALIIGKPIVPSSTNYINCYGVTSTASYGGKSYDIFNIYAVSRKYGGFANPLAYDGELTLLTDNSYTNNQFLQTVEAISKFALGLKYAAFSVADFLVLSQHPSFFDRGTTQSLTVEYTAQQTFVFTYVADKGVDWYDLMQASEQLGISETFIATSTKNGIPDQKSESYNHTMRAINYASGSNAAKLYANSSMRQTYYVGSITYYVGGKKTGTINTNVYSELGTIPGLA